MLQLAKVIRVRAFIVNTRTSGAVSNCLLFVACAVLLSACGGGGSDTSPDPVTEVELVIPEPRGLLPALNTYQPAFEGDHHSGSAECSSCHNDPSMVVTTEVPGELRDVSIGTAWETSVMAQATRDPYWHAVVEWELDNFPMLEEKINDECLVCHAPTAHDLAEKEGLDLRLFDEVDEQTGEVINQGIYTMDDSNELFNHAMDGVTCTLCHQMEPDNFGTEASMTGGYVIRGSTTGDIGDRPAYGQYEDPEVGYMRTQSNFNPMHGPHISTSESCATCHNLNVEPVTPEGEPIENIGHFAEQAMYTEWLLSDFAIGGPKEASCQACHMPVVDENVPLGQGAEQLRPDFAEHSFLGANTVMQDMFKNFAAELGISPDLDFEASIERNREFLKSSATVTVSQGELSPDSLNFDVNIENHAGHKLPSGYHSRRVYLHVQVLDQNNELVFESGRIRADGSIVGVAEDVNPALFEPHYDVITEPTQVQVYQAIMRDIDGDRTHSLLAGVGYLKDNRILPSGLDKDAAAADTTLAESFGTFGEAMVDDNFNSGADVVTYQVSLPEERQGGIYTVVAALRFQPLSYGHLLELWKQSDRLDTVDMFRTIYDNTELRDEFIDTDIVIMQ